MSQQNVKDWKDFYDKTLEIGQRVVAVRGSAMHIGEVLYFTRWGYFNPTLVGDDIEAINESALGDPQQVYDLALGIAWYDGT